MQKGLPYKTGFYRVDYYDEFSNEIYTAYLTLPLYAYTECYSLTSITAYKNGETEETVSIQINSLIKDYHDENHKSNH